MNMSDDIAGAVVNVSSKTIGEAAHASRSIIEAIARLLRFMAENKRLRESHDIDVKNKELNDIKSGKVSTKELIEHCRKNHEQIVSSEQALTKDDASILATRAKKCGIPIAFRQEKGKDNIYASIRQSDLPLYKQLTTELIKDKLQSRPQELSNFKCNEWEIPFINEELCKHDLSAQFAKTKNGEYLAIYEARDAKAIEIARSEFVRKANEVENELEFTIDNKMFLARNKISNQSVSFDIPPDISEVSRKLQFEFGFDKNKAGIAAQKFGKELLSGEEKKNYFNSDPSTAFSYISQVTWDKEDIMTKAYDCYYITPKEDSVSRIIYQQGDSYAVLNPPRMSKKTMRNVLEKELGITDAHEQDALIAKAEHVSNVNAHYRKIMGVNQDLHKHEVVFKAEDFNISDTKTLSEMIRTDADGNTFTKSQPINSISIEIHRKGNSFITKSTTIATETDQNGETYSIPQTQQLVLSFANKKTALQELKEMYKSQGVPEAAANELAQNTLMKAEYQSAEQLISIEKKDASIIVSDGNSVKELSVVERREAIEAISNECEVTMEEATAIVDKSETFIDTNSNDEIIVDTSSNEVFNELKNGHEFHPEGNILSDSANSISSSMDKATENMKESVEKLEEALSRGGR